jgi:hypothetical protein
MKIKSFLVPFALLIVMVVAWSFLMDKASNSIGGEIDKMKENVGQKVIIKNDTLMIIDYSLLNDNYTLEDGRTISSDLVSKLERVKAE